jgi:hypothetical protein
MGCECTTSQIGCVFRAAPRHAVKTLTLATLLLCLGTALVAEPSTVCRDELAAAFERLKTLPYRKAVTSDLSGHPSVGDRIIFGGTAEFLPPDRMREIRRTTTNGVAGWTEETIRVGQRAWSNWGGFFWGWREWDPILMPRLLLADIPVPADAVFECLGRVEFEGTAYLGCRTRVARAIAVIVPRDGALSDARQRELEQELQQMPQEWRTVFVDLQSALSAHDLAAQENQLDNPSRKVRYTYPNNIKIEPPVWCRLGLCRSILQ